MSESHPMLADPRLAHLTLVVYVEADYGVVSVYDTAVNGCAHD